ncbi:twin-arginine translocase subunit TatB [Paracoccus sp. S-4012]|uniref:Sec-independent protein translocase protein TatB n=1 Tax=Paracoccus sp. S-4012 TaxID=2665648 RepID=UPI0012B13CE3|nr:Sec-independent protein translocase protein TatB [Paracoccus sp. S-4012]MRX51057.1 twin-arginine translocase subunit TatB [Paracoccus sp. S-4012]
MFDVGWSELLLIGVVALIVIGPEDLPRMFHTLGRMTAKARSMAREFNSAMEDAARQSGIKEATDDLKGMRNLTSKKALGLDALDRAVDKFEKWDPKLPTAKTVGMKPDPAAPGKTPVPPAAAPAAAAPGTGVAAAAPSAAVAPEPGEAAPGKRQLKAVRRSDLQG